MSQSNHSVGNVSAPVFRSDMNASLQALASLNSGATAPSTTYANMLWYDTANNILKMRSEADDAWIDIGTLDQSLGTFLVANGPVKPTNSSGAGQWVAVAPAVGAAAVLPSGGTWAYAIYRFNSGVVASSSFSVAAGGATIGAAVSGQNWSGFAWRVA